MFAKVLVGIPFYNKTTIGYLRSYFLSRYAYNALVVCPVLVLLRAFTNSFLGNFFYTGTILCTFEIVITILYAKYLYKRQAVESFEGLSGIKIVQNSSTRNKKVADAPQIVVTMNVREAAASVRREIGEGRAA